MWRKP
jgi:hypothetical protein